MTCERRENGNGEWVCDQCRALWYGELAKTDWRPSECPAYAHPSGGLCTWGGRCDMKTTVDWQRMIDAMPHPAGEPFPGETYIADGWVYRDLPKMTQELFNLFLDILGEENAKFMTFARYPNKAVRGQFLMSPAGMERLKAYSVASHQNNTEAS